HSKNVLVNGQRMLIADFGLSILADEEVLKSSRVQIIESALETYQDDTVKPELSDLSLSETHQNDVTPPKINSGV
ncbi:17758_t:CDS:2, partial [Cetraspora pellucida]